MGTRKFEFTEGEYYHIFNRGNDGRYVTMGHSDSDRFLLSLHKFNTLKPIGSIYENSFEQKNMSKKDKALVDMVAYCLNPNHFHLLIKQVSKKGVSKFLQRILTGYTKYFNTKHKRKGALFQDKFGATHIDDDDYLLHTSAYINLNNRVHQLGSKASKLVRSSWGAYVNPDVKPKWLRNDGIVSQFRNSSEYIKFAEESLELMLDHKLEMKELQLFDDFR